MEALTLPVATAAGAEIPVPGDYNGDGRTDAAVYQPSMTGKATWLVYDLAGNLTLQRQYGYRQGVPVPQDYTGDGRTDIAVFYHTAHALEVDSNLDGYVNFIKESDLSGEFPDGEIPVPADYNGDGKSDLGIFRPMTGKWRIFTEVNNPASPYFEVTYGTLGDLPIQNVMGDWGRRD